MVFQLQLTHFGNELRPGNSCTQSFAHKPNLIPSICRQISSGAFSLICTTKNLQMINNIGTLPFHILYGALTL